MVVCACRHVKPVLNRKIFMSSSLLHINITDEIAYLELNRPDKRNAMNDDLLHAIGRFFESPPAHIRVVILSGTGEHFCAGLDLSEHVTRPAEENLYHSRKWHKIMDSIQFGGLPVISVMSGAVIGGGLELATATHVRIAAGDVQFQLPEGRRGIFVGGGATVRVGRILGADRMTEMMLTARTYNAEDGLRLGLTHYAVAAEEGMALAEKLAGKIARNAPMSNYLMIQAISSIQNMSSSDGFFTESLAAAMSQTTSDAEEGLRAFLEKRPPKFR